MEHILLALISNVSWKNKKIFMWIPFLAGAIIKTFSPAVENIFLTNSVDSDATVQNEPSDQNLHSLHSVLIFDWAAYLEQFLTKFRDGGVHVRNSEMKGLKNKDFITV